MSATINELTKALQSLEVSHSLLDNSLKNEPNNVELHKALRDASIQRFEFCVELAWKTSIKILGLQTKAPNPAIRDMAQSGLIDDTKKWFDFLEARNKTSHTYNENIAKSVYAETEKLIPELKALITRLQKILTRP